MTTTGVLPCGAANTFGADADAGPFMAIVLFFDALDAAAQAALQSAWQQHGGTEIMTCNACCSGMLIGGLLQTTGEISGVYVISFPTRTQAVAWVGDNAVTAHSARQIGVVHRMAPC